MAEFVTVRHEVTGEECRVRAAAFSGGFFPDFALVVEPGAEPPKRNASADEWRSYVVEQGFADEEAAASLSRDELIGLVPATTTEGN